jgi:hypothetical protein
MEAPTAEQVLSIASALICLITYELLVQIFGGAKPRLQSFHELLESRGGSGRCAVDITTSAVSEMHKVVREMGKYAEHCDGPQTFPYKPDENALSRRLVAKVPRVKLCGPLLKYAAMRS